jgi:hypothetical protein
MPETMLRTYIDNSQNFDVSKPQTSYPSLLNCAGFDSLQSADRKPPQYVFSRQKKPAKGGFLN